MSNAPVVELDLEQFWHDPYPVLARMRAQTPVAYVPQMDATLLTLHEDIRTCERDIEVFSSVQPDGLMVKLMGQNMMRKDGDEHQRERRAILPSVSPKAANEVWRDAFAALTREALDDIQPRGQADMVADIAMRISGEALKIVTGLTQISWRDMDRVSQAMIDGCANYGGDAAVEQRCREATAQIDAWIEERVAVLRDSPDHSILSAQLHAGLAPEQYRANVKLAISGGQNEPRDVIAGITWALLSHPEQRALVDAGQVSWRQVFEEYARWIAPVAMSPRRINRTTQVRDVELQPDDKVFLMFGSGNRDEQQFDKPDTFDVTRDNSAAISFGAGPHFCAGAWVSRTLIADTAMPMIFERLQGLALDGPAPFGGWAFRGPLSMPVRWTP